MFVELRKPFPNTETFLQGLIRLSHKPFVWSLKDKIHNKKNQKLEFIRLKHYRDGKSRALLAIPLGMLHAKESGISFGHLDLVHTFTFLPSLTFQAFLFAV